MITYNASVFGFAYLPRIHGSAVYKAIFPAVFSTLILVVLAAEPMKDFYPTLVRDDRMLVHPYTLGAIISFVSFLLTFRLNFAYGRYWEAAGSIYQMLSKWQDAAMTLAAFHYQSKQFADIYPPSYGTKAHKRAELNRVERGFASRSLQETMAHLHMENEPPRWQFWRSHHSSPIESTGKGEGKSINSTSPRDRSRDVSIPIPLRFQAQLRPGMCRSSLIKQASSLHLERVQKVPKPSLFLQELAHLTSLLSAIAMATLRSDNPCAEVPVCEYIPGQPWPPSDPDKLEAMVKSEYGADQPWYRWMSFLMGFTRTERHRILYNAARPFGVLGGVSDGEVEALFQANGPYAKVALCTMWWQEFLSREYLNGSTGAVAPPIISRLYQYISDGAVGYNQARKIAYVPFPFVHAQVCSLFSFFLIVIFPLLFYQFVLNLALACVLNILTVVCFLGLHEVARELENPFQNAPNDLPLTTFQAQFNEALVTMYAGYHPDAFWEVKTDTKPTDSVSDGDTKTKAEH